MTERLVLWASKSAEAEALPPFCGSFELGDMRLSVDGRLNPHSVKLEITNVPLNDGMLNFFKKFGQPGEVEGEVVVLADQISLTDFLPFALQNFVESFLKSNLIQKTRDDEPTDAEENGLSDENVLEMPTPY